MGDGRRRFDVKSDGRCCPLHWSGVVVVRLVDRPGWKRSVKSVSQSVTQPLSQSLTGTEEEKPLRTDRIGGTTTSIHTSTQLDDTADIVWNRVLLGVGS